MERQSQVLDVTIEHDGSAHQASYFVEKGVIHAHIDGRILEVPLGSAPAAETVRTVLSGFLVQRSRKFSHAARWTHR